MTQGISSLGAVAAAIAAMVLIVRLGGQFATGHVVWASRWLRDRSR